MKEEDFKLFIERYLKKFRKYFRDKYSNKKELKRSVYDNKNLTDEQKDKFWNLVVKN